MATFVNKVSLNPSKFVSTKVWVSAAIVLFVVAFFLVASQIYKSQPAAVVVNPNSLNSAEYHALNDVVQNEEIGSFFTAVLPQIKDTVMNEDWVSQVDIERKWGEGIVINALPRVPVAKFGSEHFIDAQGKVFQPVNDADLKNDDLIMLQGDDDQSSLIMQQMQQVNQWFGGLDMQVEDMILTPRMTWVIRFNDGMRVIVDNEHTSQKLMNLSQLLSNQLADKKENIASADLRYKNGLVIAWKDEPVVPVELMSLSELSQTSEPTETIAEEYLTAVLD